jgi:hypothetical protein
VYQRIHSIECQVNVPHLWWMILGSGVWVSLAFCVGFYSDQCFCITRIRTSKTLEVEKSLFSGYY